MEELELVTSQLEALETEMVKTLKKTEISEYLLSITRIGVVSFVTCLGELRDLLRFENARQMNCLIGYNLVEDSFGKNKSEHIFQSRAGRICKVCYIRLHLQWWQTVRNYVSFMIT